MLNFIYESTIRNNGTNGSKELREDIRELFGIKICASSIRFYRYRMGFRYRSLRKAPKLTDKQIKERYEWCLKYRNCDFRKYLFVDETKLDMNRPLKHHLRLPTSYPLCVIAQYRQRIKLNIWGGISSLGATKIIVNIDK